MLAEVAFEGELVNPGNAGRAEWIRCDEFLARHSDYIDGLMSPLAAARMQAHAHVCNDCARYDRIVRKGLDLVQELPQLEPSAEFEQRLQHRIFHVQDEAALAARRPAIGTAAMLAVAAGIALLAWSPLLIDRTDDVGPAANAAPAAGYMELGVQPPVTDNANVWLTSAPLPVAASGITAFPGPYSPLIVQPPVHRAVRTVSSGTTRD